MVQKLFLFQILNRFKFSYSSLAAICHDFFLFFCLKFLYINRHLFVNFLQKLMAKVIYSILEKHGSGVFEITGINDARLPKVFDKWPIFSTADLIWPVVTWLGIFITADRNFSSFVYIRGISAQEL